MAAAICASLSSRAWNLALRLGSPMNSLYSSESSISACVKLGGSKLGACEEKQVEVHKGETHDSEAHLDITSVRRRLLVEMASGRAWGSSMVVCQMSEFGVRHELDVMVQTWLLECGEVAAGLNDFSASKADDIDGLHPVDVISKLEMPVSARIQALPYTMAKLPKVRHSYAPSLRG